MVRRVRQLLGLLPAPRGGELPRRDKAFPGDRSPRITAKCRPTESDNRRLFSRLRTLRQWSLCLRPCNGLDKIQQLAPQTCVVYFSEGLI